MFSELFTRVSVVRTKWFIDQSTVMWHFVVVYRYLPFQKFVCMGTTRRTPSALASLPDIMSNKFNIIHFLSFYFCFCTFYAYIFIILYSSLSALRSSCLIILQELQTHNTLTRVVSKNIFQCIHTFVYFFSSSWASSVYLVTRLNFFYHHYLFIHRVSVTIIVTLE